MRMSDLVTQRIIELITQSEDGIAEICRNELADDLGCVPSQINYVLTSRFTPEHGYTIESRRGGGGYIRITRVHLNGDNSVMHFVNSIGDNIDAASATAIADNLCEQGLLEPNEAVLIKSAVSENIYRALPIEFRNEFRAMILKKMLMAVL